MAVNRDEGLVHAPTPLSRVEGFLVLPSEQEDNWVRVVLDVVVTETVDHYYYY